MDTDESANAKTTPAGKPSVRSETLVFLPSVLTPSLTMTLN